MNVETFILVSLNIFFAYHLINGRHSVSEWIRANYVDFVSEKVKTALSCSFCFAFWTGIGVFLIFSLGFNQYFNPFWVPGFASLNYILAQVSESSGETD